ncbi:MAG: restriction endonuclease subunit S [Sulfurimicrobium sp.]|nr:restriction endonuclease subunit S [Sulfurimicrobium sp.]
MTIRHFITKPLGSLLEAPPQNGYSPNCLDVPTGKWVLGLSTLNGYGLALAEAKPAPLNDPLVDRFFLKPGDFLISRSNALDKVGRVGVFRGGLDNCSFPDLMMRFRPDPTKVNPDYLEAILKGERVVKFIRQHATGTSGSMKKINQHTVESIPIPLPPITEQTQIATVIDTWYLAIEKSEQMIVAKERLRNSLLQKLFGVTVHSRTGWRSYRLSEFLSPRTERAVPSEDVPLYSLTIENGVTPKTERYDREFLVKDTIEKQYAIVYPGDIVFNPANLRWGAIARSKTTGKVVVSPIYEVLRILEEKVNAVLLANALTCPRQIAYFATKTEGTLIERMAVKLDVFLSTKIWLPETREVQNEIAALLESIETEILLHRGILDSLKKQKRGLMQKLLTGQWRVKTTEEVPA